MGNEIRNLMQHHLLWGVGLGAAVVACIQILTWAGLGLSHLTWISTYLMVVLFAILAGRSLGRRLGERPRLLQAIVLMAVMILVSRVIYQTYMFVYINFVDPTWVDTVAEVWSAQLRDAGTADEQIDRQISHFRGQWETGYIFTLGIISYGIAQFILGLVAVVISAVRPWRRRTISG